MRDGFAVALRNLKSGELPLSTLISQELVDQACTRAGYLTRATLYTPLTTILTFVAQLLGADGSCQQAVNGLIAHRTVAGKSKCSADTGGYCKALSRLCEAIFWWLARASGQQTEATAETDLLWHSRRVRIVDGSTLKIADTAKNRKEYPLQNGLQPGLHYPLVRILVVFSLSVGTVLDAAISPYKGKGTGETAMLRGLADLFSPGDILMGDRYYSGYWDIAFWLARGVDLVSIISVSRKVDFRKGQRLGKTDHIVQWKKTARPEWIDLETARNVPFTLSIREARIKIETPGFRVKHLLVVTTLTDAQLDSKDELGKLYRQRWQAELQLRSLKTHMGMEQLRCKTPAMVRKKFASYLLADNCICRLGLEGARSSGLQPREISFKHTLQSLNEFFPRLSQSCNLEHWLACLLITLSEVQVANRPGRIEPYTCKLRPKYFARPKETRSKFKSRKRQTS